APLAVHVDGRAGGGAEPAVARNVVGVRVGLEHVLDLDPHVAGELEVGLDVEAGIDNGGDAGVLVAHEIRRAAEVVVDDLTKNHSDKHNSGRTRAWTSSEHPP